MYVTNQAKITHYSKIFIRAMHFKGSNVENKAISSQVANEWLSGLLNIIFNHRNSWYNGDNLDMLIRTLYSFLNRSTNILDDYWLWNAN